MKLSWLNNMTHVKAALVASALVIAAASLVVSNVLIQDLKAEERNNVAVWAEAMRALSNADESTDLNLVLKVINGNEHIPIVVLDKHGAVTLTRNVADSAATQAIIRKGHKLSIRLTAETDTAQALVSAEAAAGDTVKPQTAAPPDDRTTPLPYATAKA